MRAAARAWAASARAHALAKVVRPLAGRRRLVAAVAFGTAAAVTSTQQRPSSCLSVSIPKENHKAEVLSSPGITMLMSVIRDKRTNQAEYVRAVDRLMAILAEEGVARLPSVKPQVIETPCGTYHGVTSPDPHTICAVDIVRSGGILLEAVRRVLPELKTAKILIQRNEETALPMLYYSKLPHNIDKL
ncbi:uprt, partial [Symbiodinium natans]